METLRMDRHSITWIDSGLEPKCPTRPEYPNGVSLDVTEGQSPFCTVKLPYPAKRVGVYLIYCRKCKLRVGCTTAGRLDDPHTIVVPCKIKYND